MKNLLIILSAGFILSSCEQSLEYAASEDPSNFVGLAKPENGVQVHVKPFPVPANFEREWYMRLPLGNKERILVKSIEMKMRPGTHHLIAYPFSNETDPKNPAIGIMRDQNQANGKLNIRSSRSMSSFIIEATAPDYKVEIPKGYAVPFEANATLDFNSHYFNKTDKTLFGEIYVNFNAANKNEKLIELEDDIFEAEPILPPNKTTIITTTKLFDVQTKILVLTSHSHKRGKNFKIYKVGGKNDGQLLHESNDYVHPPIEYFNEPLVLEKGEGFKSVITYENKSNKTIKFGVTSEDEMGIVFMYKVKK